MKRLYFIALLLLSILFVSCGPKKPINDCENINKIDSEIFIRNWIFTKPVFLDSYIGNGVDSLTNQTNSRDQGDNLPDYKTFTKIYNEVTSDTNSYFRRISYHMAGSYINVDSALNSLRDAPKLCYAATIIKSGASQNIALIASANEAIQIWVNGRVVLRQYNKLNISGYQYPIKIHLRPGENFVLMKLTHVTGDWRFFLKAASLKYVNDNSIGDNYASFLQNYLITKNEKLKIKIWSPFIPRQIKYWLKLYDINGKLILFKSVNLTNKAEVPLNDIPEGPYTVELFGNSFHLKQTFFYGDYRQFKNIVQNDLSHLDNVAAVVSNSQVLISRFNYLDTVSVKHDNSYERKIANDVFELADIRNRLKKHLEPFKNITGLHIRCPSDPDHKADSYMIYFPDSYNAHSPIPLVIMMPHETGVRNFNISTYVSDINRIEHICKLATKYHFAVLWSSFKVYIHHSLTNEIPTEVFRIVNEIRKNYTIDTTRIYGYGDCAGGELALFLANKYPSFFAAVAVEGPAIPEPPYLQDTKKYSYQSQKEIAYDFYNTLENFKSTPIKIFHSIEDNKANISLSERLVREVSNLGGDISLERIPVKKGTNAFYFYMNLMPDNNNLTKMFAFYNGKQKKISSSISFSTWQIKYNHDSWIRLNSIVPGKKAVIIAHIDQPDNLVSLSSENVNSLTINTQIPLLDKKKPLKIKVNGDYYYNAIVRKQQVTCNIGRSQVETELSKSSLTEGPQNDFFNAPFIVVKGTIGSKSEIKQIQTQIDSFENNWKANLMEDTCRIKNDIDITTADIQNYNLLLLGNAKSNSIVKQLNRQLPLNVTNDAIFINKKRFEGHDLSYLLIYPNPLNKKKYIMLGGSNGTNFSYGILKDIPFNGWYDYSIQFDGDIVGQGYFDQHWH